MLRECGALWDSKKIRWSKVWKSWQKCKTGTATEVEKKMITACWGTVVAEPIRGRGIFRVFSHPALQGATVCLSCCGFHILGWEGAGWITNLSASVHDSPHKISCQSYELNTCQYMSITGIFLLLYTKQTEYRILFTHQGECLRTTSIHLTALSA